MFLAKYLPNPMNDSVRRSGSILFLASTLISSAIARIPEPATSSTYTHPSASSSPFVWKPFASASAAMGGAPPDGHYPGYPTQVWSPTGGWWCHPKHWRRNTVFAFIGIFAVCVPIAVKSAQLEQRPLVPIRPIPSQLWCKNFGDPEAAKSD